MVRLGTLNLKGLLGVMWILPVWISSIAPDSCPYMTEVKDQLNSSLRRRYMRHYFPINYTLRVHYDEIFRLHNISKMKNDPEDPANDLELRKVWLYVTDSTVGRISEVLSERHPSYKYIKNLSTIVKSALRQYELTNKPKPSEISGTTEKFWERWDNLENEGWRSVTPKFLLDDSFRTLRCLFKDCLFPQDRNNSVYCEFHRKNNQTTTG